jgi:hypothetical protein
MAVMQLMRRMALILGGVLLAGAASSLGLASNLGSSNTDHSSTISRSWGLELTATLLPTRINTSQTVNLHVAIRNLRPVPVVLKEIYCSAIRPVVRDSSGRLMWRADYLCPLMQSYPLKRTLSPGATITSDACYGIVKGSARCSGIPFRILQPGYYTIGGAFYDQTLPELKFKIVNDDLFAAFGPGGLMSPTDGQYVRTANVTDALLATTRIQNLRLGNAEVTVLQVELKNASAATIQLPVDNCDFPLAIMVHSDAMEMPLPHPHLADNLFHEVCDASFKRTAEPIAPGQSITTQMCFDTRDHQAPWYMCIGLYERSIERVGVRIYGFDLPEFSMMVNR